MPGFNLSGLVADIDTQAFGIDFWHQALMANNTTAFAARYGDVRVNIKKDTVQLPLMEVPVLIADGGCGDDPATTAAFTTRTMEMVNMKAAGSFCPIELEPYYLAEYIPQGQNNENFRPLQDAIVGRIAQEISKKMGIIPWYGATGSDTVSYDDSWIAQLQAAANVNLGSTPMTAGGAAGTDAAGAFNVIQSMIQPFLNNVDTAGEVYTDDAIVVAISPATVDLYFRNYRTLFGDHNITPNYEILANGVAMGGWYHPGTRVRVVIQNALGVAAHAVITRAKNLVLGFDLEGDANNINLWYDVNTDLIKWRLKAKMGSGIRSITAANNAAITPNIAYYGPVS